MLAMVSSSVTSMRVECWLWKEIEGGVDAGVDRLVLLGGRDGWLLVGECGGGF